MSCCPPHRFVSRLTMCDWRVTAGMSSALMAMWLQGNKPSDRGRKEAAVVEEEEDESDDEGPAPFSEEEVVSQAEGSEGHRASDADEEDEEDTDDEVHPPPLPSQRISVHESFLTDTKSNTVQTDTHTVCTHAMACNNGY